ncbi:MAG: hypothetical protein WCJ01_08490 [Ignavibacteria bacterium]
MNVIIDIIGSTFIGGVVLLLILQLNSSLSDSLSSRTIGYTAQSNISAMARVMEKDFKKIGLGVSDSIKISTADSSKITFIYDKDNNGTIDSMSYYTSSTSVLSGTSNPNDRLLYRVVNNDAALTSNLGVTKFNVYYFDSLGQVTNHRSKIRFFKVKLTVESTFANNNAYGGAYWEKIFKPKNL